MTWVVPFGANSHLDAVHSQPLSYPLQAAQRHLPQIVLQGPHALFAQQNQELNQYGWVDRSQGIVRIPIARAMDLIADRGLPARTNDVSFTGVSALQLLQQRPEQP